MTKNCSNPLSAKNNDRHSQKQAIVIFYTMKYRKCGNFNSKNDSRPCMGASAILKSIDFRAFEINVKTIVPTQKLYQSGHAIWCERTGANHSLLLDRRPVQQNYVADAMCPTVLKLFYQTDKPNGRNGKRKIAIKMYFLVE